MTTTLAYIGLGANLGDAAGSVLRSAEQLAKASGITQLTLSPLYRSAPVDSSGPDYVNAVAAVHTCLSAHQLLALMQDIEQDYGRERPWHNAPRTLDLDLLLFGRETISEPDLQVPHPRMHQRAFVLKPLADLAPSIKLQQGSLPDLLESCLDQALSRLPGA